MAKPGGALATPGAQPKKPKLLHSTNCAWPKSATSDDAKVTLVVHVDASGHPTSASVATETPTAQGFGDAARACVLGWSFEPATDNDGTPRADSIDVVVGFAR